MIKRPLHKRFNEAVRTGRKTTTIRRKPWPVGKPIMLYHWEAEPYSSPHQDVAAIVVEKAEPIRISHTLAGLLVFEYPFREHKADLWFTEGFENVGELQEWFKAVVKKGEIITQYLMTFRLHSEAVPQSPANNDTIVMELKDRLDDFFLNQHPTVDLAEAMVCTGLCTLGMITASVPAEEQQHVFECWLAKMREAWPKLRAITTVIPG